MCMTKAAGIGLDAKSLPHGVHQIPMFDTGDQSSTPVGCDTQQEHGSLCLDEQNQRCNWKPSLWMSVGGREIHMNEGFLVVRI